MAEQIPGRLVLAWPRLVPGGSQTSAFEQRHDHLCITKSILVELYDILILRIDLLALLIQAVNINILLDPLFLSVGLYLR